MLLQRRRCEASVRAGHELGGVEMCSATDENLVRLWSDRRRWHPGMSFPFLEASSCVLPFVSLSGGGNCLQGESLDSQDRHDGGVFDAVPLLRALCYETRGPLTHSSGVRDCPYRSSQVLCTVVAGSSWEAGVAVLR